MGRKLKGQTKKQVIDPLQYKAIRAPTPNTQNQVHHSSLQLPSSPYDSTTRNPPCDHTRLSLTTPPCTPATAPAAPLTFTTPPSKSAKSASAQNTAKNACNSLKMKS